MVYGLGCLSAQSGAVPDVHDAVEVFLRVFFKVACQRTQRGVSPEVHDAVDICTAPALGRGLFVEGDGGWEAAFVSRADQADGRERLRAQILMSQGPGILLYEFTAGE